MITSKDYWERVYEEIGHRQEEHELASKRWFELQHAKIFTLTMKYPRSDTVKIMRRMTIKDRADILAERNKQ